MSPTAAIRTVLGEAEAADGIAMGSAAIPATTTNEATAATIR
jgi:hypothetical protein